MYSGGNFGSCSAWVGKLHVWRQSLLGDSGIGDNPKLFLKNFMAPFYGWGSTAKAAKPLRGESLLFTTTFSGIPGTHLTNLGMMKG